MTRSNQSAKTNDPRRRADLATIHMAGKAQFGDVSRDGLGRDDYEDWLEGLTGKRSAGKLTRDERITLVKHIRKQKMLPERPRKASAAQGGFGQTTTGQNRPTKAQWNMIGGLARDLGWDQGLEDYRLRNFVKRTAKVSVPKFMTRKDASKVILGLEEWVRQRAANDGEVPDAMS